MEPLKIEAVVVEVVESVILAHLPQLFPEESENCSRDSPLSHPHPKVMKVAVVVVEAVSTHGDV